MFSFGQPIPMGAVTLSETHYTPAGAPGVRATVQVRPNGDVEVSVQDGPRLLTLRPGDVFIFDVGVHPSQPEKAAGMIFTANSYAVQLDK